MRKIALGAAAAIATMVLAGCSGGAAGDGSSTGATPTEVKVDANPAVVELVPAEIKKSGVLRNGASTDYPPAEFLLDDNQTPTGYEVDMVKAIAKTMGLDDGITSTETFDALLPKVGSKYDIGASSFSVTPERTKAYNMIAYMDMGSQFATSDDNPKGFNPEDPCGQIIGVQKGTVQDLDLIPAMSKKCQDEGKPAIEVKQEDNMSSVIPKVISGQYAAFFADSPVVSYNVKKADGQLKEVGEVVEPAPIGVAISNKDAELTKAVQAAMDALIKDGTMKKIFDNYGASSGLYEQTKLYENGEG